MKLLIQLFIIMVICSSIVYLSKPLRAEIYLKKGITYVDSGFPFKAVDLYRKAIKLDSSNPKIYFQSGIAYGKLAQKKQGKKNRTVFINKTIKSFEVASNYTQDEAVSFYKGESYKVKGDYVQALKHYKTVLKNQDIDSRLFDGALKGIKDIYLLKGDRLIKEGNRGEALKYYSKVVNLNGRNLVWGSIESYEKFNKFLPDNLTAIFWLANTYYKFEKWEKASNNLEVIIKLEPDNEEVLEMLSKAYVNSGAIRKKNKDIKGKIKYLSKFMALGTKNKFGYLNNALLDLSNLYQGMNKWEKAIDVLVFLGKTDRGLSYFNLGKLYKKRNMLNVAVENYEKYLKFRPLNDISVFDTMSSILVKLGKYDEAAKILMEYESINLTVGRGYKSIGKMYSSAGKVKKAIKAFEKYLEFRTRHDTNIFFTLGDLYDKDGDLDKANLAYMNLEQYDTTKGKGYKKIGVMYQKRGMLEDSIKAYKKYLEFAPRNSIYILKSMGLMYAKLNNIEKAIDVYLKLEEIDTVKGEGYKNIGDLCKDRNLRKRAIEAYEKSLEFSHKRYKNILTKLALLYEKEANFDMVEKTFIRLEGELLIDGLALIEMAKMFERHANNLKSIEYYEKYLNKVKYVDTKVYFNLAVLNEQLNKFSEAIKYYNISIDKDDGKLRGYRRKSFIALSRIYKTINNNEKSVEAFNKSRLVNFIDIE